MEDVGDHHHDRGWEQLATRLRARLESTREAFPFAAAATAPAVVVPGKGAVVPAQESGKVPDWPSCGGALRKWRKSPNCNKRPAKTPKTADNDDNDDDYDDDVGDEEDDMDRGDGSPVPTYKPHML